MQSKQRHAGYLLIDHRESPGVPAEMIQAAAKAGKQVFDSGRGLHEADVFICSHCNAGVVPNPKRTVELDWCGKCDHYICRTCAAIKASTGECKPFKRLLDELQDALAGS